MSQDKRYCYGARCTWHGPITSIGISNDGLPCCPNCSGMLFENTTEDEFMSGAIVYNEDHKNYLEMVKWSKGKCFSNYDFMAEAFRRDTGLVVEK